RLEELDLRRMDAALSLHRLDEDRARVRTGGSDERLDVVQRREGHARDERPERLALRGLAGHGQRTPRPPLEPTLEPHPAPPRPGGAVALRAYLSAASTASVPELQKNACAPPKRPESRSASAAIGSVQ